MEISRQVTLSRFYDDKTIVDTYKPSKETMKFIYELLENDKKISSYIVYNEKNK